MAAVEQERFPENLQENLVTVLAYNEEHGRVLSKTLNTGLMDPDFRTLADAFIEYWEKYDKPPKDHASDCVAHIISDQGNRRAKAITRILKGIVHLSDNMNTAYILTQQRMQERMQKIRAAIIDSAEKINSKQHLAIGDIEKVWLDLLDNNRVENFDPGLRLTNFRAVLDNLAQTDAEFSSGIPLLDKRHIQPARGEVFMFLGASGRGKSWGLVNIGAEGLNDRKKVLHITLENSVYRTAQRYYQRLFNCSKRDVPAITVGLDIRDGRLHSMIEKEIKPAFSLDHEVSADELRTHIKRFGKRFDNLIIKAFPSGSLSVRELDAYIDALELSEKFTPDLVIVDYAGIMEIDVKHAFESHSRNVLGLRGLAVKRNQAYATAWQSNRQGADAKMIKATHVAEAWPIIQHSDNIVTFSSSDREFLLGLCRGFVAKGRNDADKFGFMFTQAYAIGQFCIESHWLNKTYYKELEKLEPPDGADDDAE